MLVFPHPPVSELTCGNSAIWVMVPGCICRQGQFVLAEVSGVCVCSICPGSGCITAASRALSLLPATVNASLALAESWLPRTSIELGQQGGA